MKRAAIRNLIFTLICVLSGAISAYSMEFTDIRHGFWAYKQIDKLTDEKIINGYEDGAFRPEEPVTRAQYAVMIIKTLGQENIMVNTMYSFDDIDYNHWAWNYVIRAVNLDILKPAADGLFYPDDYITRREIITFLVNILKSEDITKKEAITAQKTHILILTISPIGLK